MMVTSAYGNSYHSSENVQSGQFAFQAVEAGDYMACFFAIDHQPSLKIPIKFDWRSGVAAKDWSNVAKKGSVDSMEYELKKLADTITSIHEEMLYPRERFQLRTNGLKVIKLYRGSEFKKYTELLDLIDWLKSFSSRVQLKTSCLNITRLCFESEYINDYGNGIIGPWFDIDAECLERRLIILEGYLGLLLGLSFLWAAFKVEVVGLPIIGCYELEGFKEARSGPEKICKMFLVLDGSFLFQDVPSCFWFNFDLLVMCLWLWIFSRIVVVLDVFDVSDVH